MDKIVKNLHELEVEAASFIRSLVPKGDAATLVTLSGELGAGKTAFVKAIAKAFSVGETVTSPTFVLEKIYALPENVQFKRLVHIDAYRLAAGAELAPLGFDELMRDPSNLVILEWPERVIDALPSAAHKLSFAVLLDGSRKITYA